MGLAEADDAIWDASAVCVMENGLMADQLADYQQLLIDMPSGGQKAATTSDQGVDAREISLEVAKLLLDGLADLVDTVFFLLLLRRSLRLGLQQKTAAWPVCGGYEAYGQSFV
ncbi:hypothetical protein H0O21_04450 [Synechococcus sp. HK01-R]|nr:hypothetical protein H0O21_04450 [Synechococcus sp. HK01-R]